MLVRSIHLNMRYYEPKYPEVDELVMVQVRQIAEMGAYVKLVRPNMSLTLDPTNLLPWRSARIR